MGTQSYARNDGQAGGRAGDERGVVADARPASGAATEPGAQPADGAGTDYVWRFRLDEKPASALLAHPLDELLRVQWEELLKLTVPLYKGQPVKVDGFATMRDPERRLPIFSDDPQLARSKPSHP